MPPKKEDNVKTEYKLQWSQKYPNGMILLARGDDVVELTNSLDCMEAVAKERGWFKKEESVEQFPEVDSDPSWCYVHNEQMELQVKGKSEWYSHKTTDPRFNNNDKYDSWFCNGFVPTKKG